MPPTQPNPPAEDPDPRLGAGSRKSAEPDARSSEDQHLKVAEMMIGTAMMFVGFLNVLLSISGGYEMAGVQPMILYFAGLAIWAHGTITHVTGRYLVIGAAIVAALAFLHYGEVLFWHKQVIFWFTILLVGFFMFKSSKPS